MRKDKNTTSQDEREHHARTSQNKTQNKNNTRQARTSKDKQGRTERHLRTPSRPHATSEKTSGHVSSRADALGLFNSDDFDSRGHFMPQTAGPLFYARRVNPPRRGGMPRALTPSSSSTKSTNQLNKNAIRTGRSGPPSPDPYPVLPKFYLVFGWGVGSWGLLAAGAAGGPNRFPLETASASSERGGPEESRIAGPCSRPAGYLEAAAGMAGLIKAVLCLHHGRVPANLHCERPNPLLVEAMERCCAVLPSESRELGGRYAGVSSFGFGGTNAHVVVGGAPEGRMVPGEVSIEWQRERFS